MKIQLLQDRCMALFAQQFKEQFKTELDTNSTSSAGFSSAGSFVVDSKVMQSSVDSSHSLPADSLIVESKVILSCLTVRNVWLWIIIYLFVDNFFFFIFHLT